MTDKLIAAIIDALAMPRAIADSDDEDEILADDGNQACAGEMPAGSPIATTEGAVGGLDGSNERSTGSTERLRRDLQKAEYGLMTNSAPVAMNAPSSGSPAVQANKRRQTTAFGSESAAVSPQKKAKRTMTLKTYGAIGSGKRQANVNDDSNFERFKADNPATSQSMRFSEHSGAQSSAELPAHDSDFLNHEPAVMFRDSGSTEVDDSSAQERLLAQALASKKGLTTSAVKEAESEGQKSSPFPWSTGPSEATQKAKDTAGTKNDANEFGQGGAGGDGDVSTDGSGNGQTKGPQEEKENALADQDNPGQHPSSNPKDDQSHPRPASSPSKPQQTVVVEIPAKSATAQSPSANAPESTQKATKGPKRKAATDGNHSEPLNSDDKAIGLPKERYQPRPSRRRATQIAEEEIDYSVRPERAAKIKRTKTTHAGPGFATPVQDPETPAAKPKIGAQKASEDHPKDDDARKPAQTNNQTATNVESEPPAADATSTQNTNGGSPTVDQKKDDEIFVKPPKPAPKPKSASKAKRSHTTIFEDHVEFLGSQRSPSLSQQQAKRNSALEPVENEAKPTQRKRKTVVSDDEDDEDEEEPAAASPQKEDSPPKKRGKGRPPKAKAKQQTKSAEKVMDDSDEDNEEPLEADEAPKKRGRGRPAKAASTQAQAENTTAKDTSKTVEIEDNQSKAAATNIAEDLVAADAGTPKPRSSAAEMPTPSPEKTTEKPAATPQKQTKPSPTSHSPIKSSSGVPLRVGLSKRHRIPSLLRTMNPPKRRAT